MPSLQWNVPCSCQNSCWRWDLQKLIKVPGCCISRPCYQFRRDLSLLSRSHGSLHHSTSKGFRNGKQSSFTKCELKRIWDTSENILPNGEGIRNCVAYRVMPKEVFPKEGAWITGGCSACARALNEGAGWALSCTSWDTLLSPCPPHTVCVPAHQKQGPYTQAARGEQMASGTWAVAGHCCREHPLCQAIK